MGPFTRNEVMLLAFIAFFTLAGGVASRCRGPADSPVTLQAGVFPVHRAPGNPPDSAAPTHENSRQNVNKLENGEVKININRAGVENWVRLKGIGPALAERIIEYRNKNGAFKSVSELQNVKGIGPKKLAALRPMLEI